MTVTLVRVALPVPMRRLFDYRLNETQDGILPGCRVRVPFGSRRLIGVVIERATDTDIKEDKLKTIEACLDDTPVISPSHMQWLKWGSHYYQHPLGDVILTSLPVALRKGASAQPESVEYWRVTEQGQNFDASQLSRAPKQQLWLERLKASPYPTKALREEVTPAVTKGLENKELIERFTQSDAADTNWHQQLIIHNEPRANAEQAIAISGINQLAGEHGCVLLEGVTGSGKTEVYLQTIRPLLAMGRQILILVPEIGLTPQTVARFEQRFGVEVGLLHSGLTDNARLKVWRKAKNGEIGLIIGTRSAIFTPLARPGMIIVDEEHDPSYKQQDGWRYHARDMAVVRANIENIPLILGSATPSLESLNHALKGHYRHYMLNKRAGNAEPVKQQLLDIRDTPLQHGLAPGMEDKIRQHLARGQQVMLFINRRGYAPALICHHCGHVEHCERCDRSYTLHRRQNKLQCHHCGDAHSVPKSCPSCATSALTPVGLGTEQLEHGLQQRFPDTAIARIDSDVARSKTQWHGLLEGIQSGEHQLLIGTQILAKGHHFPHVSLVVIVDVDAALFSADFRAAEHLAQLITQVSGRAGRAAVKGELWLQTHNPGHPLLQDLLNNGYQHFARYALSERNYANLPPFTYQTLIRAEAHDGRQAFDFLRQARQCFDEGDGLIVTGPLPALMEKRQGRFRFQLLLQSNQRRVIQQVLHRRIGQIEQLPLAAKVRWSVDVDPQDFS